MSLDWNRGHLAEGLGCYRRAEFFEAHEHWESVWMNLDNSEKRFVQTLIQLTVALHHLQTGNTVGAISLARRALGRLELCPACFGGIAVAPLCIEVRNLLQMLQSGETIIPLAFPQICPVDSSPRNGPEH